MAKAIHELDKVTQLQDSDELVLDRSIPSEDSYKTRSITGSNLKTSILNSLEVTQRQTTGNPIAVINGTTIFTGETGSDVVVTPLINSGTEIATIQVNGNISSLYAPKSSTGTSGITNIGIGSVIAFAGENIPDNTLLCDGREVSKAEYEALYLIIGDKYGEASDSSKFKLPDLNERFIEGTSSDLSVGTYIEAGLPDHNHRILVSSNESNAGVVATDNNIVGAYRTNNASESNEIYGKSNTVQPPAVLMKYVIVYKQLEDGDVINTECGSGGVIDGTILDSTAIDLPVGTNLSTISYTTKNDCYLVCNLAFPDLTGDLGYAKIQVNINGQFLCYLVDIPENKVPLSFSVPAKSNSIITFSVPEISISGESRPVGSSATIKFIEYKLNSLTPQLAVPDWDEGKAVTITNNDSIADNGWILCTPVISKGYSGSVSVNGITVANQFASDSSGSDLMDTQRTVIPVSKGDIITFTRFGVTFYPVKSVSQEIPSLAVRVFDCDMSELESSSDIGRIHTWTESELRQIFGIGYSVNNSRIEFSTTFYKATSIDGFDDASIKMIDLRDLMQNTAAYFKFPITVSKNDIGENILSVYIPNTAEMLTSVSWDATNSKFIMNNGVLELRNSGMPAGVRMRLNMHISDRH